MFSCFTNFTFHLGDTEVVRPFDPRVRKFLSHSLFFYMIVIDTVVRTTRTLVAVKVSLFHIEKSPED